MRRRRVIVSALALAGGLWSGRSLAQDSGPRGAVVIGVDKCGGLPILSAAGEGAITVGKWLETQGFEVKYLTDAKGTKDVRVSDVFDAIEEFVNRGTLEQLVVYFSGHGFLKNSAEHWMLSRAPVNPNEAASLTESVEFAKDSGIPNVVFISDACRSTPASLQAERVRPSIIFPNSDPGQNRGDVDKFLASLPGKPALELPVDASTSKFQGIFTAAFLKAFKAPDETMVVTLPDGRRVVPNRKLEKYLVREVQKMAQERSITLSQTPDCDVVSEDDIYIGTITPDSDIGAPPPAAAGEANIFEVAQAELASSGLQLNIEPLSSGARQSRALVATGYLQSRRAVIESFVATDPQQDPVSLQTGFTVTGAEVAETVTHREFRSGIADRSNAWTAIEVDCGSQPACSVAIRFADGTGTVLAVLKDFIGNIAVSSGGVSNVTFDPSRSNWRFGDFAAERERLSSLRANVATSARYGVFRFDGTRSQRSSQAEQLADKIRVLKGFDPTLGLYAAYAYWEADLMPKVQSVREYMRGDLNVDLFDIAMLSNVLAGRQPDQDSRVAPFCPMLSQGWGLLRVKRVEMPGMLVEARDHLLPALWTTFDERGMDIVTSALREGMLR